jgi:hypothetical protein
MNDLNPSRKPAAVRRAGGYLLVGAALRSTRRSLVPASVVALLGMAIPAHALVINPTFDSSLTNLANAAQWESAINYADGQFASLFSDAITINITFKADSSTGVNGHNDFNGQSLGNYGAVKTVLAADAKSADDATSIAHLPISDPTGGGNFILADAQAKALGVRAANNPRTDGTITINYLYPYTFDPNNRAVSGSYDFIGIAEHEISEVMGRVGNANIDGGNFGVLDLFGYQFGAGGTGTGVLNLAANQDNNYFCIDGGITPLKLYNNHADGGDDKDWGSGTDDSFNTSISSGAAYLMSPVDIREMDVIGYDLAIGVSPVLSINSWSSAAHQLVLSWSTNYPGCTLQSSTDLGSTNWTDCASPTVSGASFVVTNSMSAGAQFFRLKR